MTQKTMPSTSAAAAHSRLAELLVAYDLSDSAESALKYAVMLSRRFRSFVHLLGVQNPAEYALLMEAGPQARAIAQRDLLSGLQEVKERLRSEGIGSDFMRRVGNIADTIEGAILDRPPDLLFLGAYGFGRTDRQHLGSTAEHLLRTVQCPVFVVGPRAILQERTAPAIERILCAVSSLDMSDRFLSFAGDLTAELGASLELVHTMDAPEKELSAERRLDQWKKMLEAGGIPVSWVVVGGRPDEAIAARAAKSKSSLILFELHRSGTRMVDCPDGVVSATIRESHCPVMTVPSNVGQN